MTTGAEATHAADDTLWLGFSPLPARVLAHEGFDVVEAEDAERALELAGAIDGEIVLLVSDVIMGSMTGAELNNIPGTASLRAINGSAIVTFDSSSSPRIPTEGQLPKSFETSIRKTGM